MNMTDWFVGMYQSFSLYFFYFYVLNMIMNMTFMLNILIPFSVFHKLSRTKDTIHQSDFS